MNETQRNSFIATHEDDALDKYLDSKEEERCERCLINEVYVEHNDQYICQSCYEDACEQAEMAVEMEREENE